MKLAVNFCLLFFSLIIYVDKSFSLTDFQIKKICKKEKRQSECIKDLKEKRFDLENGKLIEIPVIPYRK
tara:strand:+ start:111 stop:317 length:207 start_codon:yes stop_codon:yes gene_type:complete